MEHLSVPVNGHTITVPCVSTIDYDHGNLKSYPQRRGWEVSTWRHRMLADEHLTDFNLLNGKTVTELLDFLQTWLVFGLLHTCLFQPIRKEDFVRDAEAGQQILTTAKLEDYLQAWKAHAATQDESSRKAHWDHILASTDEALLIADNLDHYAKHVLSESDAVALSQQVFAIYNLEQALCSANRKIYHPGVWFGNTDRSLQHGSMSLCLEQRMNAGGWCPHAIRKLKDYFDHDAQAYAYGLGTKRTLQDHSGCSQLQCVSTRAFSSAHHRSAGCRCEAVRIDMNKVVEVLEGGQIPVFNVTFQGQDFPEATLVVEPIVHDLEYYAVSHVWADGMANPSDNELPTCQLQYLHHTVSLIRNYEHPEPARTDLPPPNKGAKYNQYG